MRWLQCASTSFSVRPFACRKACQPASVLQWYCTQSGIAAAQFCQALLYLLRRGRRNRLRGLHLLQNEIAIDQTLQSALRRVACAVDAEWLQDGVTHLFRHVALQDNAAVDDRDHVIENHHLALGYGCDGAG